jgi:SEFIR domain
MTDSAAVSVIVRFAADVSGPDRDQLLGTLASASVPAWAGWDLAHRAPDGQDRPVRALLNLTADVAEIAGQSLGEVGLALSRFLRSVSGPEDGACAEVTDASERVWEVKAIDPPVAYGLAASHAGPASGGGDEPLTWRGTHWSAGPADPAPPPSVFVSYAHDSAEHKADVLALCSLLAAAGIAPVLDQVCLTYRQDWYLWAIRQIRAADFILVIASERCRIVGDGANAPGENLGLTSEMGLLRELSHSDSETWTRRVLPVVLPGHSPDEIPLFLQPWTKDHYIVPSLTADGLGELLGALRGTGLS